MPTSSLLFYVNGERQSVDRVDPEMTLLRYLREVLGLKGSKLGCGEGGCGACTVVIGRRVKGEIEHFAVNACLMPIGAVNMKHVITVEGLGSAKNAHPIQKAFANQNASQCGYCTPGFVMSLYAKMRSGNKILKEQEVDDCFDGNLCRCTGYRPIIDAAKELVCPMQGACCKNQNSNSDCKQLDNGLICEETQELIFPAELQLVSADCLSISSDSCHWYAPISLNEALEWYQNHPKAKIVFGNTEVGIEVKSRHLRLTEILYLGDVEELDKITDAEEHTELGAGVKLQNLLEEFSKRSEFTGFVDMLKLFAGTQIRNVSSWAGNVVTASPISDLLPVFMVLDCTLTISSHQDSKTYVPVRDFVKGYRQTTLKPGEIVTSILIPHLAPNEKLLAYKQSKRKHDDITIVNMAFKVTLKDDFITDVDVAVGGVAPSTIYIGGCYKKSESNSSGTISDHIERKIFEEIHLDDSTPGGFADYRKVLVVSMIHKMLEEARGNSVVQDNSIQRECKQVYPTSIDPSSMKQHLSGLKHATGEAIYCDDMPKFPKELYAGLVLSKVSHGILIGMDTSKALDIPGVHSVITAADIPGKRLFGPVVKDEEVIFSNEIQSSGQIIAIVLANDQVTAQRAARHIIVEVETLPAIMTLEQAIQKKSFLGDPKQLNVGDINEQFDDPQLTIIDGSVKIHGQEHFYLETQASIVVPEKEDDQITIYSSTQNPSESQEFVAGILGIPENRVVCKVCRLGGGFGGKESRANFLAAALAVAAHKSNRPVRCQLDRDEDFQMTGQRHPFFAQYKVAVTKDGLLKALDVNVYCNGGHSMDLSGGVLERAMSHIDNCYYIPNASIKGWICKTNTPSNTAFRGFGGPQGMFICETIMDHIASTLGLDPQLVRYQNLYQKRGQLTPFNMIMEDCSIRNMWESLLLKVNLESRRNDIESFNKLYKYKKRGLAMVPTKFGIAFGAKQLNQAGCIIHLLKDGSVQISHGGVEMGQGIHTKMVQVVSSALKVDTSNIHHLVTDTSHVANTSASAASATSDLNGAALLDACDQLNKRLESIRCCMPNASFKEIVQEAYRQRIDLTARGFYATPDIGFDWKTGQGRLFNYFTFGVAVSEVEVDVLTGTSTTLSSSIFMDLGVPINPAIDIGQIEGAFVQGLGLFTMEELWWSSKTMTMLTVGPGNYKIPTLFDCPKQFEVELYGDNPNPRAINSSRAVGEPPLFLAASVFFAIKDAIRAARCSTDYFRLDSPATCARIRLAIDDDIVKRMNMQDSNLLVTPWSFQI